MGNPRGMRSPSSIEVAKTTGHNVAGIYTYESIGYVFPIGDPQVADAGITLCTSDTFICAFGPLGVDPEDFKKLARLKITFAWGDNRPEDYSQVIYSRLEAKLLNEYAATYHLGGHAEVLKLADPGPLELVPLIVARLVPDLSDGDLPRTLI